MPQNINSISTQHNVKQAELEVDPGEAVDPARKPNLWMDGCQLLFGQHSWRVHEMNMANYNYAWKGDGDGPDLGGFARWQMARAIELTIEIVSRTHLFRQYLQL